MPEDRDALLRHFRRSRDELLSVIDGLSDELMTETSLDGWSVKDHLAHIADWDDIRASEVARISAGHDSAWRTSDEQGDAYNAMSYDLRRGLTLEHARWEFANSRQRLLEAIAASTERGLDASLYGDAALVSDHEAQHVAWIKRWRSERCV